MLRRKEMFLLLSTALLVSSAQIKLLDATAGEKFLDHYGKVAAACAVVTLGAAAYDALAGYSSWYEQTYPGFIDRFDNPKGLQNFFCEYLLKFRGETRTKAARIIAGLFAAAGLGAIFWGSKLAGQAEVARIAAAGEKTRKEAELQAAKAKTKADAVTKVQAFVRSRAAKKLVVAKKKAARIAAGKLAASAAANVALPASDDDTETHSQPAGVSIDPAEELHPLGGSPELVTPTSDDDIWYSDTDFAHSQSEQDSDRKIDAQKFSKHLQRFLKKKPRPGKKRTKLATRHFAQIHPQVEINPTSYGHTEDAAAATSEAHSDDSGSRSAKSATPASADQSLGGLLADSDDFAGGAAPILPGTPSARSSSGQDADSKGGNDESPAHDDTSPPIRSQIGLGHVAETRPVTSPRVSIPPLHLSGVVSSGPRGGSASASPSARVPLTSRSQSHPLSTPWRRSSDPTPRVSGGDPATARNSTPPTPRANSAGVNSGFRPSSLPPTLWTGGSWEELAAGQAVARNQSR